MFGKPLPRLGPLHQGMTRNVAASSSPISRTETRCVPQLSARSLPRTIQSRARFESYEAKCQYFVRD
jgi:hypothetical protein